MKEKEKEAPNNLKEKLIPEDKPENTIKTNQIEEVKDDELRSSSLKDDLKLKLDNLTILSNDITMNLQEFDKKIYLKEKRKILFQLNIQSEQFKNLYKEIQKQFCIVPQEIKKLHVKKLKEFFHIHRAHCENITQKRNIYNTLIRSYSFKNPQIDIDLGDDNKHLFDFSKIDTVMRNAETISKNTDEFIKKLEEELKTKSIIEEDDPGYQHYKKFEEIRKNLIRENNITTFKYVALAVVLTVVIVSILYYVIFDKSEEIFNFII